MHVATGEIGSPNTLRADAVRRATRLNRFTLGWNFAEGVVAVAAGSVASSSGLIGFGLDSFIEVSAALVLAWRLSADTGTTCVGDTDRRATRMIAISFAALAVYTSIAATIDLIEGHEPDATGVGIALAALSLVVMPILAKRKRALAPILGSAAQEAEAKQTSLCALLSAVLLFGLVLNALLGWWWADPLAALLIATLAAIEAKRTWHAKSLADTCCAG